MATLGTVYVAPEADAQCLVNHQADCSGGAGDCTVNVQAYCAPDSTCTINVQTSCNPAGSCDVNVQGWCSSECTVNLNSSCATTGNCLANALSSTCSWNCAVNANTGACSLDGQCLTNVQASCSGAASCDVNVQSACRNVGDCEVNVMADCNGGDCTVNVQNACSAGSPCEVSGSGGVCVDALEQERPLESLLRMEVGIEGDPTSAWQVTVHGTTLALAAPDAQLVATSPDGTLVPASGDSWSRALSLAANTPFQATFQVGAVAGDEATLRVSFFDDEMPDYTLDSQYEVKVVRKLPASAGDLQFEVTVLSYVVPCCADASLPTDFDTNDMPTISPEDEPLIAERGGDDALYPPPPFATAADGPETADSATTTISGTITFWQPGATATAVPCRLCYVEVWDEDTNWCGGHDFLGSFLTNYDGSFFINNVNNDDCVSGQDVYFKVRLDYASAPARIVRTDGSHYWARTNVKGDCGSSCPLSADQTRLVKNGDGSGITDVTRRALWIWDGIAKAWNVFKNRADGPHFNMGKAEVRYPTDGWTHDYQTDGANTAHSLRGAEMHLGSNMWQHQHWAVHEWGHYVMRKGWSGGALTNPYPGGCAGQHVVYQANTAGCAWAEGWANYVVLEVFNTATMSLPGGTVNFESRTCSTSCVVASGDRVELNVAGTLWDIRDGSGEGSDNVDRTLANIWTAFRRGKDTSQPYFSAFYSAWQAAGFSKTEFQNAARQNTINYA